MVRISKFLSFVLRHKPEAIGLVLDEHGWAVVDDLLELAKRSGRVVSRVGLERVVAQVVLRIDAKAMHKQNIKFYVSENGVYNTFHSLKIRPENVRVNIIIGMDENVEKFPKG
jgi:RNA:NAD 2'-phosphotransferase (TPT1/KptA family)